MSKKLAIILVNWNSVELTKDTLESLQQTTYTNYDCILVDNGSIDGSGDLIEKQFPNCIVLKSATNKGFTGGNNIGMDYALQNGYEYMMMLNNDVAVEPDFLEPLIDRLDQDPSLAAVQPLIYFHHDRHLIWNAGSTFNPIIGNCNTPDYNKKDPDYKFKKTPNTDWIIEDMNVLILLNIALTIFISVKKLPSIELTELVINVKGSNKYPIKFPCIL